MSRSTATLADHFRQLHPDINEREGKTMRSEDMSIIHGSIMRPFMNGAARNISPQSTLPEVIAGINGFLEVNFEQMMDLATELVYANRQIRGLRDEVKRLNGGNQIHGVTEIRFDNQNRFLDARR
jgi:hypothetical protein